MSGSLLPGVPILVGALAVALLYRVPRLQQLLMLALPVAGFAGLTALPPGSAVQVTLFDYPLTPVHVDRLSLVFGYVFHVALLVGVIFSLHVRDTVQHVAGLVYAGSAIGGVFAGDLISLFVYWELTAVSSVFLIWARGTERSYRAGLRYLIVQVGSGVLLLSGILVMVQTTGSLAFRHMELVGLGPWLIFLAFGIKVGFPLLHGWLQDAYPEATVTGSVFLSAFTTKLALYALARGFAGTDLLVTIGVVMALFPIVFALLADDLRRTLSYSLISQLGFMVVGVGIGTELAINGAAAHAVASVLYKALLFMATGAVLYRTGTVNASALGGLSGSMPKTAALCLVGSASICALPLTSGFVTKSLTVSAAAAGHDAVTWAALLLASVGAVLHTGIKIPFAAFYRPAVTARHDVREAPANMLVAMAITAVLCIAIGVLPGPLYRVLPHAVDYHAYSTYHIVNQVQLVLFAVLGFILLSRTGLAPRAAAAVHVDVDALYRKLLPAILRPVGTGVAALRDGAIGGGKTLVGGLLFLVRSVHDPDGIAARTWLTSSAVGIVLVLLIVYLSTHMSGF